MEEKRGMIKEEALGKNSGRETRRSIFL